MTGKLGPYEILEPLGKGGMGEVYLAEDTRLGRKVAIKVLPEEFASIPERLARFEQEARAAAALNHPHIAVIHDIGFEPATADGDGDDGGGAAASGVHYLVQEYLEGQTLRAALTKGALPLNKALDLATEVAEALAAAHAAGIVHRDLKPDNVFVTDGGHAKVLDFGLAKLTELGAADAPGGEGADAADTRLSRSPTSISPTVGTAAGQVMGTAGYMAPEQVEGGPIDHRTDIFAFGCVLYEMVSGRRPFAGRSTVETLQRIVHEEPEPIEAIAPRLPGDLRRILRKCLAKEPEERARHAGDLVLDLRVLAVDVEAGMAVPARGAKAAVVAGIDRGDGGAPYGWGVTTRVTAVGIVLAALVLGAFAGWRLTGTTSRAEEAVSRFSISLGRGQSIPAPPASYLAISPDGRNVAYAANFGGGGTAGYTIYLRRLVDFVARPLPGTEGGFAPFFSPDGRWLGFYADGRLRKVSLAAGGQPVDICETATVYGASWGPGETIIFSTASGGLERVSAAGGEPERLLSAEPAGATLWWPHWLPDGDAVVYTSRSVPTQSTTDVYVYSLATNERKLLVRGASDGRYVASGHLVFAKSGSTSLIAAPFDPVRLEITGPQVAVLDGVATRAATGVSLFAVSNVGSLVYLDAETTPGRRLVWVDRGGVAQPIASNVDDVMGPRISPDGRSLAFWQPQANEGTGLWIHDLKRETTTRFTLGIGWADIFPVWSPDGAHIVFSSRRAGPSIWRKPADLSGDAELLDQASNLRIPMSWSPDGRTILFYEVNPATRRDIWTLTLGDPRAVEPWLATEFNEKAPVLSPDGRWLAYVSDQSGRDEVYVQPFPVPGAVHQVSATGGAEPRWAPDGGEIFYRVANKMMVVPFSPEPEVSIGRPGELFEGRFAVDDNGNPNYDVAADGRFVMVESTVATGSEQLRVVLNWFEELERLVRGAR